MWLSQTSRPMLTTAPFSAFYCNISSFNANTVVGAGFALQFLQLVPDSEDFGPGLCAMRR